MGREAVLCSRGRAGRGGPSCCEGLHWALLSMAVPRAALGLPRTVCLSQVQGGFAALVSFLCACLSVLFACSGDQPLHKPRSPDCPARPPDPHDSAQPHGQGHRHRA